MELVEIAVVRLLNARSDCFSTSWLRTCYNLISIFASAVMMKRVCDDVVLTNYTKAISSNP